MKCQIKKTSKLLLICFTLVLTSCEKELYENQIQQTSKKTISRKISFEEFKAKPIYASLSSKIKNKLEHDPTLDTSYQLLSKSGDDYTAYTNEIVETILGDKTTYSMLAEKQNIDKDKLYNLMFEEFQGVIKEHIIEYQKNSADKLEYIKKYNTDFILEHSFHLDVPLDIPYDNKITITIIYHSCSYDIHAYGDSSGAHCPHDQYMEIQIEFDGGDCSGVSSDEGLSSIYGTFDGDGNFISGNNNLIGGYFTTGFGISAQALHLLNVIKAQGVVMTAAQQNSLLHNITNIKIIIEHLDNPVFINWMLVNMMQNHFILNEQVPYYQVYTFENTLNSEQITYLNSPRCRANPFAWHFK